MAFAAHVAARQFGHLALSSTVRRTALVPSSLRRGTMVAAASTTSAMRMARLDDRGQRQPVIFAQTYATKARVKAKAPNPAKKKEELEALQREVDELQALEGQSSDKSYLFQSADANAEPFAHEYSDLLDFIPDVLPITVPPLKTDRNLVNNILSMDKTFAASIGAVLPEPKFLSSVRNVFGGYNILYREVSHFLLETLDSREEKANAEEPLVLIDGANGTGKSVIMLHAVHHAIQKKWIVIYLPELKHFTVGKYPYQPVEGPDGQTVWMTGPGCQNILKHISGMNGANLDGLVVANGFEEGDVSIPAGSPLKDLIAAGIEDEEVAAAVSEAVLKELVQQKTKPVLIAMDSIDNIIEETQYRDTNGKFIKLEKFMFFRELAKFARAESEVARGAVVFARSDLQMRLGRNAWKDKISLPAGSSSELPLRMLTNKEWCTRAKLPRSKLVIFVAQPFSYLETDSVCELYRERNDMSEFPYSVEGMVPMLQTISQGNPRQLIYHLEFM